MNARSYFSLAAADGPKYAHLTSRLAAVDLVDLWPFWMQPPAAAAVIKPHVSTDDPNTVCIGKDQPFCREPDVPTNAQGRPMGQRIDYVFVERPRTHHTFTLDFTRRQRRAFQFTQSEVGFLSDHVGLDLTLIATL